MNPRNGLILVVLAAIVLVLFASFVASQEHEGTSDRIGIIGAMDIEVATIIEEMDVETVTVMSDMEFNQGKLSGKDVIVVKCDMGKVNAGICASILINNFGAKYIINTGVAGSLDNRLNIGDIVISTDAVQHDFDVSPIGYEKGEIPYTGLVSFEADETLRGYAVKAVKECVPEVNVLEGRVCSGDQFIASDEQKDRIVSEFGGLCCEMEGGAIAQVCHLNDIPYVIIRAISDKADGSDTIDYPVFERIAALRCADIVAYMVENCFE